MVEGDAMIPVFCPSHNHLEHEAVKRCLDSGWTGLGPRVAEFEEKFSEYVNAKHSIATNSGTAALHLAFKLLDIGPGDEVIVPALTFISTAQAVAYTGAKPIFCDIDRSTLLMDFSKISQLINGRTKAIVPVLYGGQPIPDPQPIFYCDGSIPIVYDCAHACGAKWDAKDKICCYSFHSVKNLSCGDGGMLTVPCSKMAKRARQLRWCGIDTSTYDRATTGNVPTSGTYKWEYDIQEIGYKCHMNDLTASIGLVQLAKMDDMQLKRLQLVIRYGNNLPKNLGFRIAGGSSWHLMVIRTDRRNELADFLRTKGINTGVHYKPIHLYPCWNHGRAGRPHLPIVEDEWKKLLTLPLFPDMTMDQVDLVCAGIKEFFS